MIHNIVSAAVKCSLVIKVHPCYAMHGDTTDNGGSNYSGLSASSGIRQSYTVDQ